jgi:hypothetical protein
LPLLPRPPLTKLPGRSVPLRRFGSRGMYLSWIRTFFFAADWIVALRANWWAYWAFSYKRLAIFGRRLTNQPTYRSYSRIISRDYHRWWVFSSGSKKDGGAVIALLSVDWMVLVVRGPRRQSRSCFPHVAGTAVHERDRTWSPSARTVH